MRVAGSGGSAVGVGRECEHVTRGVGGSCVWCGSQLVAIYIGTGWTIVFGLKCKSEPLVDERARYSLAVGHRGIHGVVRKLHELVQIVQVVQRTHVSRISKHKLVQVI